MDDIQVFGDDDVAQALQYSVDQGMLDDHIRKMLLMFGALVRPEQRAEYQRAIAIAAGWSQTSDAIRLCEAISETDVVSAAETLAKQLKQEGVPEDISASVTRDVLSCIGFAKAPQFIDALPDEVYNAMRTTQRRITDLMHEPDADEPTVPDDETADTIARVLQEEERQRSEHDTVVHEGSIRERRDGNLYNSMVDELSIKITYHILRKIKR